jgi:Autotransporter beta-domain
LIAGVTAGYVSSDVNLNALTLSGNPGNRGGGSSRVHGNLSGPTAGLYATYFNGGFSTDLTLRVDALTLDESFNDFLVTTGVNNTAFVQVSGSVPLLNGSIFGNLNYRFNLYPNVWIEPTVGAGYTNSSYGSNAADFGLADGTLVMVQGGARFGTSTLINNRILMTTTLTGLAYDDVLVAGGFIPTAAFGAQNLLVQADQGFVRGRGILALNFDFGDGISSFVQGEVRGGRYQF